MSLSPTRYPPRAVPAQVLIRQAPQTVPTPPGALDPVLVQAPVLRVRHVIRIRVTINILLWALGCIGRHVVITAIVPPLVSPLQPQPQPQQQHREGIIRRERIVAAGMVEQG